MPDKTISQLETEGYVAIECWCQNPDCRNRVHYPFKLIRQKNRRLATMLSAMTIAELGERMPCGKCGERVNIRYAPAPRQEDAQGYAHKF